MASILCALALAAAHAAPDSSAAPKGLGASQPSGKGRSAKTSPPIAADSVETALFAGGSFWCLEAAFEKLPGVDSVTAGYAGGQGPNPSFESVTSGNSAYVEAVRVSYRPARISYKKLLDAFWRNVDPTRADGQFSDAGAQYHTAVFFLDSSQAKLARASLKKLEKSKRFKKPIVTEITPATVFYPAEAEHQDFYKKNPGRYQAYVKFSGREAFFRKVWGTKP